MKAKIIIAILLLSQINCKSQTKDTLINNNIKKDTMRYFDKEKYKKLKLNPKYSGQGHYLDTNGDEVNISGSATEIYEDRNKVNSPITYYYVYHSNFVQKAIGQDFYTFSVGISKEFNPNGELIKEVNHDLPYKFSLEMVCELIKKEYDIDLMKVLDPSKDRPVFYFSRTEKKEVYKDDFRPVYEVMFYNPRRGEDIPSKTVTIDGTTGKILYETLTNSEFKEEINKLPKSKTQAKVINPQNKNILPIGNNDNKNPPPNNNLLITLLILIAISIVVFLFYTKQQEETKFNNITSHNI